MRLAHEIVVPSGYLVGVFAKFGLQARSIFNFVDVERLSYRERSTLRPVFLSNRNFQSLYNVACTVRAFARIQREMPEARLIVAGFGPERQSLEALVGSLGLRHVEFRGRVNPADMPSLYDEADVYLNSPNIDNMPTSVIEAFAAGLPVVTTDAGGIPFIVTHEKTGLMVARDDDAALAAAALRLFREPALSAAIAGAARRECLERYVWQSVRSEWLRVYRSLSRTA